MLIRALTLGFLALIGTTGAIDTPSNIEKPRYDHLFCWKLRQDQLSGGAVVNMLSKQKGFNAENCKVLLKSLEFCVPADKEVTTLDIKLEGVGTSGPDSNFQGQTLRNDFLCYRIVCKSPKSFTRRVKDQFAMRKISISHPVRLCTPAKKVFSISPPNV